MSELSPRKPSQEFYTLVEEFAKSFEKPKVIFQKIVEVGRNEGFTDFEIDLLVGSYLKGRVNRNTLLTYRKEFLQLEDKKVPEESTSQSAQTVHIEAKKVIEDNTTIFRKALGIEDEKEEPIEEEKYEVVDLRQNKESNELETKAIQEEENKPIVIQDEERQSFQLELAKKDEYIELLKIELRGFTKGKKRIVLQKPVVLNLVNQLRYTMSSWNTGTPLEFEIDFHDCTIRVV